MSFSLNVCHIHIVYSLKIIAKVLPSPTDLYERSIIQWYFYSNILIEKSGQGKMSLKLLTSAGRMTQVAKVSA
jgi:hypothetical protein